MTKAEVAHDQKNHATYVKLQSDMVAKTVEIEFAKVFVDLDGDSSVIGIEILGIYYPMVGDA